MERITKNVYSNKATLMKMLYKMDAASMRK